MVMGGFSIEDILSTPHKRDQKKDQKKDQRSNYQRNLSHAPYSAFDLPFSSDAYKVCPISNNFITFFFKNSSVLSFSIKSVIGGYLQTSN